MSNIDKQALREEFQLMQDHYSDPADRERQVIYIAAEALLDDLETKDVETEWMRKRIEELAKAREVSEEQRANWFQMAQKLGEDLDVAEKRIAELEAVREVFLRAKALMYQSGGAPIENSLNPIDAWLYDAEHADAGIGVKGD